MSVVVEPNVPPLYRFVVPSLPIHPSLAEPPPLHHMMSAVGLDLGVVEEKLSSNLQSNRLILLPVPQLLTDLQSYNRPPWMVVKR